MPDTEIEDTLVNRRNPGLLRYLGLRWNGTDRLQSARITLLVLALNSRLPGLWRLSQTSVAARLRD